MAELAVGYWPDCRSESVNVGIGVDWNETLAVCI